MALGIPLAGWGIITTALAAGAGGAQAIGAKSSSIDARRNQQKVQQNAEAAAASAQNRATMEERKANPNAPDALALLGKEQLASLQGLGTSSLNSPTAITPKIKLGQTSALGV